MRRWIGLAIAGGVLCLAPVLLRTGEGAKADEGEELAKAKSNGFTRNVTPPPLTGVDLVHLKLAEEGAVAPAHGGRVAHLTIDPQLQRAAEKILGGGGIPEAAIVLTETRTGRVLVYANHVENGQVRDLCAEANAPAASVFKIVTGSALVDHAQLTPETKQCYWGGEHKLEAANLIEDPRKDKYCATLAEAMGRSLNTVMARLASKHLDQQKLGQTAKALGFGEPMAFDVPVQPNSINLPEDPLGFARTAAGFWNTTLSPIAAAQLAMTVANRGVVVKPYVVERVTDPKAEGKEALLYRAPQRHILGRALRAETADAVTRMMEATVTDGTGYKVFHDGAARAYLPNIPVAGKTGTLTKQSTDQFYTWFVGFAPSRAPEVAVSVLVVNKSTWRVKANLLARQMLQAYFAQKGAPGVQAPRLFSAPERAMRSDEIDVLLRAHRGRAASVARFHVLRQPALDEHDASFLAEHASSLDLHSLQRWLSLLQKAGAPLERARAVLDQIALLAQGDAADLVAHLGQAAPSFDPASWAYLRARLAPSLPPPLLARLPDAPPPRPSPSPPHVQRSGPRAGDSAPPDEGGGLDLGDLFGDDDLPSSPPAPLPHGVLPGPDDDWSASLAGLDERHLQAVRQRASTTARDHELVAMLSWLEAHGTSGGERVGLASSFITRVGASPMLLGVLGRSLDEASWQAHGPRLFRALLERGAIADACELLAVAASEAPGQAPEASRLALGSALLSLAEAASLADDPPALLASLAALLCARPGPELAPRLRSLDLASPEPFRPLSALLALQASSLPSSASPSLEDATSALHALADAWS